MFHEWRDDSNPYRVGPSIWIQDGKLKVRGQEVLSLPVNQWVRFEIMAALGGRSTGTWNLTITVPDQPPRHFMKLKNGSPDWKTTRWLGFSSTATAKTVFYLDNIELTNLPE